MLFEVKAYGRMPIGSWTYTGYESKRVLARVEVYQGDHPTQLSWVVFYYTCLAPRTGVCWIGDGIKSFQKALQEMYALNNRCDVYERYQAEHDIEMKIAQLEYELAKLKEKQKSL